MRDLSNTLRRLAANLRASGIEVEFYREKVGRKRRMVGIRKSEEKSVTSVTSNTYIGDLSDRGDASLDEGAELASPKVICGVTMVSLATQVTPLILMLRPAHVATPETHLCPPMANVHALAVVPISFGAQHAVGVDCALESVGEVYPPAQG